MRLPKWLDRELRIHDLKLLYGEKKRDAETWFRLYRKLAAEIHGCRVAVDEAREEIIRLRAELDKHEGATPK